MSQKARATKRTKRAPRPYAARPKLSFSQREVMRCIKAAQAMKLPIGSVEVDPATGKIRIIPGTPDTAITDSNPWDKAIANAAHKERTS
jgi:hypothetical protein